jgi:hypothetical protein
MVAMGQLRSMADASPSSMWARVRRARLSLLLLAGTVVGAIVVIIANIATVAMVSSLADRLPPDRAGVRLGSPLPPGDEFAAINRVTHWPPDWTAAVCNPPVYELRIPYAHLPHATACAACEARIQPNGEYLNITIARFPDELAMQVDLLNDGFEWYAFAFDRGELMAFATHSEAWVTDPITGMGESPTLQPLKEFGFNIYSDPGP